MTATRNEWRRAAFVLFAVAAGTNVPTPLLLVYKAQLHLSAQTLTALFGVYAAGLVPSLLSGGPLSDRFGRRRVMRMFVTIARAPSRPVSRWSSSRSTTAARAYRLIRSGAFSIRFSPRR